jgi:predicted CDP-diglyceride synthetase/phosphatidate cytidylyltransferase
LPAAGHDPLRPSVVPVTAVSRADARASRSAVTQVALSPWTLIAIALAALFVPPVAVVAAFTAVAGVALREALPAAGAWSSRAAFVALPLQFALVAAGAWPLAATFVPLFAALALPLVAVCTHDTAELADRCARRYFAVMLFVYGLSHAAALAMRDAAGALLGVVALAFVAARVPRIRRMFGEQADLVPAAVTALAAPLALYALRS